jgi:hypothetical protein
MSLARIAFAFGLAAVLIPLAAEAQQPRFAVQTRMPSPQPAAAVEAAPGIAASAHGLLAAITLADIGFANGVRFANLGGHRELFVPLPQSRDVAAGDLVLVIDDVSAHDARRNLEVLANDRTVAALVLDGKSRGRSIRISLGKAKPKDGYIKLSFLYSGAATLDRCIDVRYVGDSLTIRPETAIEVDLGGAGPLDVATTAALMPREVALALPPRRLAASEIAAALTVARSLIASGRQVAFHRGFDDLTELARRDESGRWRRGIILVGTLADAAGVIDAPLATVAGATPVFGTLAAVRIGGAPALVVADTGVARAGVLLGAGSLAATRGIAAASVGDAAPLAPATDRMTFDQLGIAPAEAEVFGRAELSTVIDTRRLPGGTRPARVVLDVMVAPDGAGAKAVVSAFVNERLLGSAVAASNDVTRLDLPLPDGLVGTNANIRAVVQRDSAQGDCRFEPQGYPAQILGSSTLVLAPARGLAEDFSDLVARWSGGIELSLPATVADQPTLVLDLVAEVINQLSPDNAPIHVSLTAPGAAPSPSGPFLAVSDLPPAGSSPRVRFDRGRVAVADRSGRTLLDLGGFVAGAVAQVVGAGDNSGLWIKPLSASGTLPAPIDLRLDRGDVAFLDGTGVALAMSTEHDTVIKITYPDQVSWLTVADRFRTWIIAGLWLFATATLLLALQRMFRRAPSEANE